MNKILVTGASGFVGGALVRHFHAEGYPVHASVRARTQLPSEIQQHLIGDIDADTFWGDSLLGVDVVVHCAALASAPQNPSVNLLSEFRKVNVDGTMSLARQAASHGVSRFIFISSIKVNGEGTSLGHPYSSEDEPAPEDFYGQSKMEAERALHSIARETGMDVVIVRPVLIYGAGVKGNFRSMMSWLNKGFPLPLSSVNNKRSLLAIDNLVGFISTCLNHPNAAGQTFLLSDGDDLSTPDLLQRMGKAMGCNVRLFPFPLFVLDLISLVLGRRNLARRLVGSLQVDVSPAYRLLNWKPPVTVDEGLSAVARDIKKPNNRL